mgnify:CR=1 FL=1
MAIDLRACGTSTDEQLVGMACGVCGAVVRACVELDACFRCRTRYAEEDARPRALLLRRTVDGEAALAISFRGDWTDDAVAELEASVRAVAEGDGR